MTAPAYMLHALQAVATVVALGCVLGIVWGLLAQWLEGVLVTLLELIYLRDLEEGEQDDDEL